MSTVGTVPIRRELQAGDLQGIAELQWAVYATEHGLDEQFAHDLDHGLTAAIERGWPQRSGAIWLIGAGAALSGCLALTDEGGFGRARWFVLAPELRGQGLGRRLFGELLVEARRAGHEKLELETFSALTAAAHIYRGAGFRVVSERETDMWGPPILLQHYELALR